MRLSWVDVSHEFGLTEVLRGIDLTLEKGRIISLVGPSGCGKSTLLAMAAGLIEPSGGEVENRFERTAMMFQEHRLLPWRRARENIAFGLKARVVARQERRRVAEALGLRMGLDHEDMGKFPHELSGGMRSRVALARALAVAPDLLLLDEPFSALDVGLRRDLQDLVSRLIRVEALSAILVTHDISEAVRMSDEIIVLAPSPGRIVYRHGLDLPVGDRDETYVFQTVGRLMQVPEVNAAFRVDEKAA